jgi:hypothetical protein
MRRSAGVVAQPTKSETISARAVFLIALNYVYDNVYRQKYDGGGFLTLARNTV